MEKFIPREKMSKKARKEHDLKNRAFWAISPVTKLKESKKAYNRKKTYHGSIVDGESFLFCKAKYFINRMA